MIFALINIVGVEFLINFGGLGQLINDLAERYDLPGTYAAICFVDPGQRHLLLPHRTDRAMAETGRLTAPAAPAREPGDAGARRDHRGVLLAWEARRRLGLLFRDVVPSLLVIGRALVGLLADPAYLLASRRHRGRDRQRRSLIGGLAGLAVGILLGANRFLGRAFERYLYYLGPTPKIIFFPVMIMWFGVGPGSKVAMGTLSCFFPVALSAAAGMRADRPVLIRVGRSFRARTWQMVTKIYLPAMREPIVNGVRLGPRRRDHRHAAGRDQAVEPRHRLPHHQRLFDLQHAAHVCAADRAVRARDRRECAGRPAGRLDRCRRSMRTGGRAMKRLTIA